MTEADPRPDRRPGPTAGPVVTVDESPPTRGRLLGYGFVRAAIIAFSKALWRMEVHGSGNVPATGGFILSPVHRSNIDTPIVCAVTRRRMRYIGKEGVWKYRWSAWLFTNLGGWAVHRGTADRAAMRRASDRLREGEPVVLFPEGNRRSGPVVEDLFDGPAYLACRTGVPIVPVGIGGSLQAMPKGSKLLRPVKVVLVVGRPIPAPELTDRRRVPRRVVKELTDRLRQELQVLYDDAQARAGVPKP